MSEKVIKSIRTDEDAWHMAKVEAAKRGIYMGDLITEVIRWSLQAHTMTCPNCEKDFELYPLDYIEDREEMNETAKTDA